MKKISLSVFVLIFFSCGPTMNRGETGALYKILAQNDKGGASIRFYEILTESSEIKMLENDDSLKEKVTPSEILTSNFIFLNMGEKPTGGYSIGIESVIETDKNIIVTVKEISPETNALVTQEITNPFCVVKIKSKKEIIIK